MTGAGFTGSFLYFTISYGSLQLSKAFLRNESAGLFMRKELNHLLLLAAVFVMAACTSNKEAVHTIAVNPVAGAICDGFAFSGDRRHKLPSVCLFPMPCRKMLLAI